MGLAKLTEVVPVAKSPCQPTLPVDPAQELGRGPGCLLAKGCCSPPEPRLLREQLTKAQEANGAQPGGRGPKITRYWSCASCFFGREDIPSPSPKGCEGSGTKLLRSHPSPMSVSEHGSELYQTIFERTCSRHIISHFS